MPQTKVSEVPYNLKLSGAVTAASPMIIQLALKTCMSTYMKENNLSISAYSKRVGVSQIDIMGILNDVVVLDQFPVATLYRLLTFHGYNMIVEVEQKQPTKAVVEPVEEKEIAE